MFLFFFNSETFLSWRECDFSLFFVLVYQSPMDSLLLGSLKGPSLLSNGAFPFASLHFYQNSWFGFSFYFFFYFFLSSSFGGLGGVKNLIVHVHFSLIMNFEDYSRFIVHVHFSLMMSFEDYSPFFLMFNFEMWISSYVFIWVPFGLGFICIVIAHFLLVFLLF